MSRQYEKPQIDRDQNYFQLSSIQSVSLGFPAIIIGEQLASHYGAGVAICSILLGNLTLWLIAMGIISMAFLARTNAIQNVKIHLGKYGALFSWAILIISFVNWFVLQINFTIPPIGKFFQIDQQASLIRLGAGIGFFTALLSTGGIRLIKWVSTTTLPIVCLYYIYATTQSEYNFSLIKDWGLSIPATIGAILTILPGSINYPTFFRHARSRADCYLALTIMTLLISFFEIATIWIKMTNIQNKDILSIATISYIIWSLICINLVNIYFASACWENFVPRFEGARGYAIIGLLGTAAYTFIQVYKPIVFLENLTNCFIASLGVVLLIAFLIQLIIKHRPRPMEKLINSFCWLIGCIVSTILTIQDAADSVTPLLAGIAASAAAFVCILFIEENMWAIRKVLANK